METLDLDIKKRYTYADYLTWFDDLSRELINGFIYLMTPAPSRIHQRISVELTRQFSNYLHDKKCEIYVAPFDVRFPTKRGEASDDKIITVVQPDICIVCDELKLDDRGCLGAPDLIVEIISFSSVKKDIEEKFKLYEENGVKEYWIVQPNDGTLSVFFLTDGKYQHKGMYTKGMKVPVWIFEGKFSIDLDDVFRIKTP